MGKAFVLGAAALVAASLPVAASAATTIEFSTDSTWQWKFGTGSYSAVQPVNPGTVLSNGTYKPALPNSAWISSGERDARTGLYSFKGILPLSSIGGAMQEILLSWRSDNFVKSVFVNNQLVYSYNGPDRNEFGSVSPFQHSFSTTEGDLFFVGNNEFVVNVQNRSGTGIDPVSLNMTFFGSAVPEPGTWMLMILGIGAVGFTMRRRQIGTVRFQLA